MRSPPFVRIIKSRLRGRHQKCRAPLQGSTTSHDSAIYVPSTHWHAPKASWSPKTRVAPCTNKHGNVLVSSLDDSPPVERLLLARWTGGCHPLSRCPRRAPPCSAWTPPRPPAGASGASCRGRPPCRPGPGRRPRATSAAAASRAPAWPSRSGRPLPAAPSPSPCPAPSCPSARPCPPPLRRRSPSGPRPPSGTAPTSRPSGPPAPPSPSASTPPGPSWPPPAPPARPSGRPPAPASSGAPPAPAPRL
mmetsp:Transcript_10201/g.28772  ORF Transcript_10201/g.28772 Transcript_10201/m.28772 type:complete len:248 (-) Transcript_10201:339-1082(-)